MATITKTAYDTDFVKWAAQTAEMLRQGRFEEVDLEHVAEEIEDLGKSDFRSARSHLQRMLMHLIKQKIQPERDGSSWRGSILNAKREILFQLQDSPSLRPRLANYLLKAYREAVEDALAETGWEGTVDPGIPRECPFTLSQLLDSPLDSLRL